MTVYRVRCRQIVGNGEATTSTVWEGDSVDELSTKYPPSEIWGADPFDPFECSDFSKSYAFETQTESGDWDKCNDPRVRVTPVTDYERAIDEENRRLYPGDYMDDDFDDQREQEWCCQYCNEHVYLEDLCDLNAIILDSLRILQVRDDCTVYDHPVNGFIVVKANVRVAVDPAKYRADARPLHWLREAAMTR